MLCCVVVVREYLCKKHIHVIRLLMLAGVHCGIETRLVTME